MNAKGKKTLGFTVPDKYPHTGKKFVDAVDKLFEVIWNELPPSKQKKIAEKYSAELEILNWRCE